MPRKKSTLKAAEVSGVTTLTPIPTPPINLHNLDAIRREMGRVYRDMRNRKIDSQDGTRLVYVLSQMAKVHEIAVLEKKLAELERLVP
jgi:hypothetical protein